ncbi:MAG: DUF3575 domain-containing protein [Bacteroidaceae bacterium]|nr:DUF3575 domain-containing protein [Bacteroidaceae bacterium]
MYKERVIYNNKVWMTMSIVMIFIGLMLAMPAKAQTTTDSIFLARSSKVIFKVNSTEITPADRKWIIQKLVPTLRGLGPNSIIIGRSAASPEGPFDNNKRLAEGRREALKSIFEKEGINTSRIRFDTAIEEYALLVEMMREHHDPDYEYVKAVVDSCAGNDEMTKGIITKAQGGKLFNRLKDTYFAELRAVRIMVYYIPEFKYKDDGKDFLNPQRIVGEIKYDIPEPELPLPVDTVQYRREMLSVKTNLLLWGAYVPEYGMCPIPNVSVEYYPRHGHFTLGASFDCPWWIGNTTNHKYFELRNYTLETRYYTRSTKKSYSDQRSIPNGKAAFKGFYVSAYAHAFLYQIGLNANKGWIGEGAGAGIGLGYVIPLSKKQHWRLELGAQFGVFRTKYDPFVYGCPVEKIEDGLYYYDYTGDADLFKERQYRFTWLGPTRAGITLTYDLLYRKRQQKGGAK